MKRWEPVLLLLFGLTVDIFAESSSSNNEGGVAIIVFLVAFVFMYSTVLGKKKDARTKTGYKDNKEPMNFVLRLLISFVVAVVATGFMMAAGSK